MKRQAFYSFNYGEDAWRASQVRNMGLVDGNRPATDNEWQDVSRGGEAAIKRWINKQMEYRSVVIVLIGAHTAGRKWINYEIEHAWSEHKGVLGVYINRLLDRNGQMSAMGINPFTEFNLRGVPFVSIVPTLNPSGITGRDVYASIKANLPVMIEHAIRVRSMYP